MIFIPDKFHKGKAVKGKQRKAHQDCTSSFSMDYWKELTEIENWQSLNSHINSSTAEQINAKLRKQLEKWFHTSNTSSTIEITAVTMTVHNGIRCGLFSNKHSIKH